MIPEGLWHAWQNSFSYSVKLDCSLVGCVEVCIGVLNDSVIPGEDMLPLRMRWSIKQLIYTDQLNVSSSALKNTSYLSAQRRQGKIEEETWTRLKVFIIIFLSLWVRIRWWRMLLICSFFLHCSFGLSHLIVTRL